MSALFLVIPIALIVSAVAVYAFVWSVKGGQMDDLKTPALRILEDDSPKRRTSQPRQGE